MVGEIKTAIKELIAKYLDDKDYSANAFADKIIEYTNTNPTEKENIARNIRNWRSGKSCPSPLYLDILIDVFLRDGGSESAKELNKLKNSLAQARKEANNEKRNARRRGYKKETFETYSLSEYPPFLADNDITEINTRLGTDMLQAPIGEFLRVFEEWFDENEGSFKYAHREKYGLAEIYSMVRFLDKMSFSNPVISEIDKSAYAGIGMFVQEEELFTSAEDEGCTPLIYEAMMPQNLGKLSGIITDMTSDIVLIDADVDDGGNKMYHVYIVENEDHVWMNLEWFEENSKKNRQFAACTGCHLEEEALSDIRFSIRTLLGVKYAKLTKKQMNDIDELIHRKLNPESGKADEDEYKY